MRCTLAANPSIFFRKLLDDEDFSGDVDRRLDFAVRVWKSRPVGRNTLAFKSWFQCRIWNFGNWEKQGGLGSGEPMVASLTAPLLVLSKNP